MSRSLSSVIFFTHHDILVGLAERHVDRDLHFTHRLKNLLRDGAARTVDKLWELCGRILEEFTETECRNYFRHCGYRQT